jgi:hypothetical protein
MLMTRAQGKFRERDYALFTGGVNKQHCPMADESERGV